MTRGHQKLSAFLMGFPLFVASVALTVTSAEAGDRKFPIFWPMVLFGLALWLWGVFAPMKDE